MCADMCISIYFLPIQIYVYTHMYMHMSACMHNKKHLIYNHTTVHTYYILYIKENFLKEFEFNILCRNFAL